MLVSVCLPVFVTLNLVLVAFAAIGPIANLTIENAIIAPDGYPRSYVIYFVLTSPLPTAFSLGPSLRTASFQVP